MWKIFIVVGFLVSTLVCGAESRQTSSPPTSPNIEDIHQQVQQLRLELNLEKRFRAEGQSQHAIVAESLRRLQRSFLVSAQQTRESFIQVREEQTRLEQNIIQQTDASNFTDDIAELRTQLQVVNTRLQELEAAHQTTTTTETPVTTTEYSVQTAGPPAFGVVVDNFTLAIGDLTARITTAEEHQIILQTLVDETSNSFKSKLRRKVRHLKEDLENRFRDYNGAMTTFASDMRVLRQEIERNVNNIKTTMAVESRKVSDSLHVVKTAANQTKEDLEENLYYIAKAQQEQLAQQNNLEGEVEDLKYRADDCLESLHNMDTHITNVTMMVKRAMTESSRNGGVVELQVEVLCPHPYVKSGPSCLSLLQERLSWTDAQHRCRAMATLVGGEGDLAIAPVDTHPIRGFVRKKKNLLTEEPFVWVGASSSPSNTWLWVNDVPLNQDLFPWGRSEPDPSVDQSYLCIKVSGSALFHNCLNTSLLYSVCQLQVDPLLGRSITFEGLHQHKGPRDAAGFTSDLLFEDLSVKPNGTTHV